MKLLESDLLLLDHSLLSSFRPSMVHSHALGHNQVARCTQEMVRIQTKMQTRYQTPERPGMVSLVEQCLGQIVD
ncbi:MAG: hypothetical protein ACYDER_29735 [Ktedonobacteraceae bacterium]